MQSFVGDLAFPRYAQPTSMNLFQSSHQAFAVYTELLCISSISSDQLSSLQSFSSPVIHNNLQSCVVSQTGPLFVGPTRSVSHLHVTPFSFFDIAPLSSSRIRFNGESISIHYKVYKLLQLTWIHNQSFYLTYYYSQYTRTNKQLILKL